MLDLKGLVMIRFMLAIVRRPGARMAPISSTWACSQERWTKNGAKVMISAAKRAGRSGMAVSLGGSSASLDQPLASSTRSDQAAQMAEVELRLKGEPLHPKVQGSA